MSLEIERKFLVCGEFSNEATEATEIVQGYLSPAPGSTVRIRIRGEKGYITVKGKSDESGIGRYEWEKEIPVAEAKALLLLCEKGVIDKTRFEIKQGDHVLKHHQYNSLDLSIARLIIVHFFK